jgi:hypothetical protein
MITVRSPIIMRAIPMLIITPIHLTLTYGYRPYTYSGYVHAGFGWTGRYCGNVGRPGASGLLLLSACEYAMGAALL